MLRTTNKKLTVADKSTQTLSSEWHL